MTLTFLSILKILQNYRKDKDETEPRIIPEEAEIVRTIFKMYDEGYSLDQIKSYLEEKGVKTSSGKTQWSKENIRRIFKTGAFSKVVFLSDKKSPGKITKISEAGEMFGS